MPAKENKGDVVLATKGLPERRRVSFIKVSGRMRSDAFKRRPVFSFTVTISTYNNFLLLLKSFITTALEYKAILKFKTTCMCCYAFLSVEFLFT